MNDMSGAIPETDSRMLEPINQDPLLMLCKAMSRDVAEERGELSQSNKTQVLISGSEQLEMLKESYSASKDRISELGRSPRTALQLKVHGKAADRIYSALSTLLYASISVSKASELERYIRKKAAQLPTSVFDLTEWDGALAIARECRLSDFKGLKSDLEARDRVRECL
jgi:hypothetical protein